MEALKFNRKLTVEEYVAIEQQNNQKYEYHDGDIRAFAGGSIDHSTISGNIFVELSNRLKEKGKKCRVFNSDTKLHLKKDKRYVYPDAMVVCGDLELSDEYKEAVVNPVVIFEVLSPSTMSYDLSDKFEFYRRIEGLKSYVLVYQERPYVLIYEKKSDLWGIKSFKDMEGEVEIPFLDLKIPFAEIYENVEFDQSNKKNEEGQEEESV